MKVRTYWGKETAPSTDGVVVGVVSAPGDDVLWTENVIDTPPTTPDSQLPEVGLVPDYDNDSDADSDYEVVYPLWDHRKRNCRRDIGTHQTNRTGRRHRSVNPH